MAEDSKTNDTPQTSEGDVNTPNGPVTPGDAEVMTDASPAAVEAPDLSNTYENGVPGANINQAVPEGAHVVTDYNEALDKGYFGYARGENLTEGYTLAEAGKRNARLRDARNASVNTSAEAEDKAPKRARNSRS